MPCCADAGAVAVAEFLDPKRPHALVINGKDVVVWNDGPTDDKGKKTMGAWRCFEDACPHRLVPLSEGRVEKSGELLCAYHAWRFDGSGACTSIPQADEKKQEGFCKTRMAACRAMPMEEIDGLLWVWPETGADAALESLARRPRLIPELHAKDTKAKRLPWNMKDLPYGWDYFMENVLDPAHVPVSHHNIVGNRYTQAKPIALEPLGEVSTQEGFKFSVQTALADKPGIIEFQPPWGEKISNKHFHWDFGGFLQ